MFRNPGGKIKSYAKVLFWVGVVISIIIGVIEIGSSFVAAAYSYHGSFGTILLGILGGILTVAIGTLISWLAVLTLYAFGTLVENSDELVRLNGGIPSGNKTAEKIEVQDYAFILVMNDRGFPLLFLKLFLFSLTPKVRILIEGGCKKKRAFLLFCEVLFRL